MTIICGMKLTHDGAVAVVEESREGVKLVGSMEVEKHGNRHRHAPLADSGLIPELLAQVGLAPADVDRWVVDGWYSDTVQTFGGGVLTEPLKLSAGAGDGLVVAPYCQEFYEDGFKDDGHVPMYRYESERPFSLDGITAQYESYRHSEGHLASAYATVPNAEGKPVLALLWDGRLLPQVYLVSGPVARQQGELNVAALGQVRFLGNLMHFNGMVFEEFCCNVGPFVPPEGLDFGQRVMYKNGVPGKAMAYAGLGQPDERLVAEIKVALQGYSPNDDAARLFHLVDTNGVDDPSKIASLQDAIGQLLTERLARYAGLADTLCFAGGSALNIKWNSAIRASGMFEQLWVPPFCNDSGSAVGAACASLLNRQDFRPLDWSVYSGAPLGGSPAPEGWQASDCGTVALAHLLAEGNAVVVLSGRAELGPRALGHRSILADPRRPEMKQFLNEIKGREDYRPVAPMCLERYAPEIFNPGTPDPYMLFDHKVHPAWASKIPAVIHVDGTARLQTVAEGFVADLVWEFFQITGVPVLCNTSANLNGKGFFPDARSAMLWGKTNYVWSDGVLYTKNS